MEEEIEWHIDNPSKEWIKMSKKMMIIGAIAFFVMGLLGAVSFQYLNQSLWKIYSFFIIFSIIIPIVWISIFIIGYYCYHPESIGFSYDGLYFLYKNKKKEFVSFKNIFSIEVANRYGDYRVIYLTEKENKTLRAISNENAQILQQKLAEYKQKQSK